MQKAFKVESLDMNLTPIVSIIIPCYNSEGTILRCIESVLNQGVDLLEIIVVDDGSTDNSYELLSIRDDIILLKQDNKGAPSARNLGLSVANGEFVKFLDADDMLLPGCLERQLDLATKCPDDVVVYGDYLLCSDDSERRIRTYINFKSQLVGLFFTDILTSTPLHRRRILDEVGGFDTRLPGGQEWNLHIRLAAAGAKFCYDPNPVYKYIQEDNPLRISKASKAKGDYERLRVDLKKEVLTHEEVFRISGSSLKSVRRLRFIDLALKARDFGYDDIFYQAVDQGVESEIFKKAIFKSNFFANSLLKWIKLMFFVLWKDFRF